MCFALGIVVSNSRTKNMLEDNLSYLCTRIYTCIYNQIKKRIRYIGMSIWIFKKLNQNSLFFKSC